MNNLPYNPRINVRNMGQFSAQEVFDFVSEHLLSMDGPSFEAWQAAEVGGKSCVYRGGDGRMCAAGCLLGDEDYVPAMEHRSWESVVKEYGLSLIHLRLISMLQEAHDRAALQLSESVTGPTEEVWKLFLGIKLAEVQQAIDDGLFPNNA